MTPSERAKAYLTNQLVSEFLDALDEVYPEQTPHPGTDTRDIDVAIGQRQVIRTLLLWREEAREDMLENQIHVSSPTQNS